MTTQPTPRHTQRGLSLLGLIFFGGLLAVVGLVGMKALPTVLEYVAVRKAIERVKGESTPAAIRVAFDRITMVDNIESIDGKDLIISQGKDGRNIVGFAYNREIHLAGPAYLLLKYEGATR